MKKILTIVSICICSFNVALAQEIYVNWADVPENIINILKLDDEGIYCRYAPADKKKKTHVGIVKYDYNLKKIFSNEFPLAGDRAELEGIISLKDNIILLSRTDNKDSSRYFASVINKDGKSSNAKHLFSTVKAQYFDIVNPYHTGGLESNYVRYYISADRNNFALFYNYPADAMSHGMKVLKADEQAEFSIFDSESTLLYNRKVTLPYKELEYKIEDIFLSKNNKLLTYGIYDTKKGKASYKLNIFGKSVEEDKDLSLPQDQFAFYDNSKFAATNDKTYLGVLCTNKDEYYHAQGLLIYEIDDLNNKIISFHYPFTRELITQINDANKSGTDKKEPGIKNHKIRSILINSNGNFNILFEESGERVGSLVVLEMNKDKIINSEIIAKKQDTRSTSQHWKNLSVASHAKDDKVYIFYNDHADNFNSDKPKLFLASAYPDVDIILSIYSDGKITKNKLSNKNDKYYIDTYQSKGLGSNMVLLSNNKDNKYRLGVVKLK